MSLFFNCPDLTKVNVNLSLKALTSVRNRAIIRYDFVLQGGEELYHDGYAKIHTNYRGN